MLVSELHISQKLECSPEFSSCLFKTSVLKESYSCLLCCMSWVGVVVAYALNKGQEFLHLDEQ